MMKLQTIMFPGLFYIGLFAIASLVSLFVDGEKKAEKANPVNICLCQAENKVEIK